MPFATGPQQNLVHYRIFDGGGPAVVLVQGLGLSGRFWFTIPQGLAAAGYRVVVPDNRGTGQSELPPGTWPIGAMADDVAAVLDAEDIDHATVVGISMGGMIAQHVALRHPGRCEGLVLLATTCGLPHGRLPPVRTLQELLSMPFLRGKEASTRLARLLLPEAELGMAREHLRDWPAAMAEEGPRPRTFFKQVAAVATHSTGARLRDVRCPTLIVTGDCDVLVPPANAQILARRIPGAMLEVLQGVGHAIPALDRDVVLRCVQRVRGDASSDAPECVQSPSAS